jgi:molybdopterin-guanine dinucleotide biosynthesis protein A
MPKTAALLVGGRATRLGGADKSQLLVGGRTILDRQIEALRGVVDRILIVDSRPRPVAVPGAESVLDLRPGTGSLGALYTAIATADDDVIVVACDMPFVTGPFLRFLGERLGEADAAVPRTADGWHPLCAAYARGCLGPMARSLDAGSLKIADTLARLRVREIGPEAIAPFDRGGALLLNLNTPDDLARAAAAASASGSVTP